jgi:hypothetical protein
VTTLQKTHSGRVPTRIRLPAGGEVFPSRPDPALPRLGQVVTSNSTVIHQLLAQGWSVTEGDPGSDGTVIFRGTFVENTTYRQNDVVQVGSATYKANQSTSSSPPGGAWDLYQFRVNSSKKEPWIWAGTTTQYLRGDKLWVELNASAVGLGNVENVALSTWAGSTNLVTLGHIDVLTANIVQTGDLVMRCEERDAHWRFVEHRTHVQVINHTTGEERRLLLVSEREELVLRWLLSFVARYFGWLLEVR